jgi:hypothetical protein
MGTDIKGLGQFNEFCSGGVGPAHEDRDLQTEAWRPSCCRGSRALPCLQNLCLHRVTWYRGTSTATSILDARRLEVATFQVHSYELDGTSARRKEIARGGWQTPMPTCLPQMCKWNAFTIDTSGSLCKDESPKEKIFTTFPERRDGLWLDGSLCLRCRKSGTEWLFP